MKVILALFFSFFKMGLFTFGGGYAMLPMLQREVVETHKWVTEDRILDYYAIGQCTPGVIAVNVATFVGVAVAGFWGGVVATFAVVLPSFLIITLISSVLQAFSSIAIVAHALAGIRVGVAVLVIAAAVKLFKKGVKGVLGYGIFLVSLILLLLFDISPVWIVLGAGLIGVVQSLRKGESK